MKKMVLVFMAIFVGAVVAEDLEMHRFGGGYGSVRYFATSPLEKGSPAEVALVVVHGWGGGAEKCEEAKSFLGAAAKLLREGERMPYVIEPLFPRRAVLKKHDVSAEGLSLWNESWSRDLTQRGRAVDDWRGGGDASNGSFSSYEVIDFIFSKFGDKSIYPNLRRVVLAGFSAGGQFVSRYAAVGKGEVRASVEMAYVAMSPSTWLRLDPATPWHYGLDGRTRYSKGVSNDQVLTNLTTRTVVYACGSKDVSTHGALDKNPPAMQPSNRA